MSGLRWEEDGRDWPNREASRFVSAGGVRFHLQDMGSGPTVVLLHGTGASSHSWRDVLPTAARQFRSIAPDLPGHGFSTRPDDLSLPGMARAVGALLLDLGVEADIVVGHSSGAAIAFRMALDALDSGRRPPRAILSVAGALEPFPGMAGALFPALARLLVLNPVVPALFAMRALVPGETGRFLRRATGSRIDARGEALYAQLFRSSAHVGAALGMMAAWDLTPLAREMHRLHMPILLLHGERDASVPPAVSRTVARRIASAEAEVVPGLGHLLHEEKPELLADRLEALGRAAGLLPAAEAA